ncbi:hypothetical protein M413DRAFT_121766 [Hebeloma cylindrosporum]|uniref:Uncharacterized protein n=1 Tax=Hebeloma cylindrosporum TaxID=76867 RepID=A0A0C2XYJ5_HEBCY|nr:hypothetical protein M413DRAFT_121766 [Hebeloma cylindrosporum h7]
MTCSYSYGRQSYTTGFQTGPSLPWPEGAESHRRELMAVPGNALQHGASIVICDRATDNLNVAIGTKTYSWPKDVDYPTINVDTGEAVTP